MMAADLDLIIREFIPGDEIAFRRLNEEWIARYFTLESKDEEALADPRRTILERGGRIFFAVLEGKTVGCCALLAMGPGEYEVAKMAVTESSRGAGIGRSLLERVVAAAHGLPGSIWKPIESLCRQSGYMNRLGSGIFHLRALQLLRMPARMFTWS